MERKASGYLKLQTLLAPPGSKLYASWGSQSLLFSITAIALILYETLCFKFFELFIEV